MQKKEPGSRPGRDKFRPASTKRGESGGKPPHSKKEPAGSRRYEMLRNGTHRQLTSPMATDDF